MPHLEHSGDVWLLNLGDGENRLNPGWVSDISAALDEVERATGPRALVTRADGKFWSNGLDLDWMGRHTAEADGFLRGTHRLLASKAGLALGLIKRQMYGGVVTALEAY